MKKFEGWMNNELQFIASLMASRNLLQLPGNEELYNQVIREIRNRRVNEELFQMKLEGIEEE
jgi:hypothetical protein